MKPMIGAKCPPHHYRPSGKPFRSVVGKKKVKREYWRNNRRFHRLEDQIIMGPPEQVWFCTKCEKTIKSVAGPPR